MSGSRHSASPAGYWSAPQAYILATVTLLIGLGVGYLLRGSEVGTLTTTTSVPVSRQAGQASNIDVTVQPLLLQLQSRPNDPVLLARIGNTYYDGQQYAQAIEYYGRALKIQPNDVDVRTDMGTAMWYSGDADGALRQFEQSLQYQPTHAQTLFNMGIVKWQGKKDNQGALQAWERLLATNPNYGERQKVIELMQKVRSGAGS